MDLSTLQVNDTGTLELIHPVTGPTGVIVTVRGPFTPEMKAKTHAAAEERARDIQRRRPLSVARMEAQRLDLLSSAVVGWSHLTDKKKPFPCTPENVRELLGKNEWIARQVDAAYSSDATFFALKR